MLIRARRATVRLQPTGSRRLASSPPPPILGRGQREEEDDEEEAVGESFHPPEWYRHTYPRLLKMSQALRRIDRVDGRVLRVEGGEESTVADARTIRALRSYAATVRAFAPSGPVAAQACRVRLADQVLWFPPHSVPSQKGGPRGDLPPDRVKMATPN